MHMCNFNTLHNEKEFAKEYYAKALSMCKKLPNSSMVGDFKLALAGNQLQVTRMNIKKLISGNPELYEGNNEGQDKNKEIDNSEHNNKAVVRAECINNMVAKIVMLAMKSLKRN